MNDIGAVDMKNNPAPARGWRQLDKLKIHKVRTDAERREGIVTTSMGNLEAQRVVEGKRASHVRHMKRDGIDLIGSHEIVMVTPHQR